MHYIYLALAILGEVIATSTLKASEEFTKPIPTLISVVGYMCTLYFLTLALKVIPIGIAYAIWAGVGIIMITVGAYFIYEQSLDFPAVLGITLITAGVIVIQLFSQASAD